jgi:hypothetical protein
MMKERGWKLASLLGSMTKVGVFSGEDIYICTIDGTEKEARGVRDVKEGKQL